MKFGQLILMIIFWTFLHQVSGQSFKEDIRKCQSTYRNLKSLKCQIHVKAVDTENDNTVFSEDYLIMRKKDKYLYSMKDLVVMLNDQYSIMVVKPKKTILYKKRSSQDGELGGEMSIANIDSIFNQFSFWKRVSDQGVVNNVKNYKITFENNIFNYASFDIDLGNHTLKKVVYSYNQAISGFKGYVLIEFKNVIIDGNIPDDAFDEKKYAVFNRNGGRAVGDYTGFDVLAVDSFKQ